MAQAYKLRVRETFNYRITIIRLIRTAITEVCVYLHYKVQNIQLFVFAIQIRFKLLVNKTSVIFRSKDPFVAPCEGTNSARLFTPGERKALAKSNVH